MRTAEEALLGQAWNEGVQKGKLEGKLEGKHESSNEIALKMLKIGADVDFIQKCTNLPEAEILKLKSELRQNSE